MTAETEAETEATVVLATSAATVPAEAAVVLVTSAAYSSDSGSVTSDNRSSSGISGRGSGNGGSEMEAAAVI